jgi:ParB family chromosome partitioning protein
MSQWWEPTAESYLHQVPKALILEAVRESHSEEAAAPLEKLKKDELVARAEALLAGRGWLPAVLRSSHVAVTVAPNT